jgi:transcriptional regulator with XRE-family HTH domain
MGAEREDTPERQEAAWLGELIRTRRRGRFSLESLARRAGVSAGLLSEIERGMGNPSYFTLLKLADALEMEPAEFFRESTSQYGDDHLVRVTDRQRMSFPDGRYIEILSPRLDLTTVMWRSVYPPGADSRKQPSTVPAETCLVVTRGRVQTEFQGRSECLEEGDALRLEAGALFGIFNPGSDVAESLSASAMPPF